MRVVGGVARGRILKAPAGRSTRPTSDRVREAIFSMLSSMDLIEGATVLDLFAGSGALGIEALSRGAVAAVLVDDDPAAVRTAQANLSVLGELADRAHVIKRSVEAYVRDAPFADLALADPPYSYRHWPELLEVLAGRVGVLVVETGAEWEPGPAWETVKVRKYGSTVVTVVRPLVRHDSLVNQEGDT